MRNNGTEHRLFRRGKTTLAGTLLIGVGLIACSNPENTNEPAEGNGNGGDEQVIVFDGGGAWGDAQREAFFEPFEEETGIEVIPNPAGGNQPAIRASILAGDPGMDVVNVGGGNIGAWENEGILLPIDFDSWEDPAQAEDFEPFAVSDYRVPSLIHAVQLAWDEEVTGEPLTNWADFWDVDAFPGERSMRPADGPGGAVYEIALLADGVDPEDLYPLDFDRALDKLSELRASVPTFWDSGAESVQLLMDGQISAVAAWNGRVEGAREDGAEGISSTWEQAVLQVDFWAIPEGAKNVENAQQFIEFVAQPERQAHFAELITYAPTIPEAYEHISEDRQQMLATSPEIIDQVVEFDPEFWAMEDEDGNLMPQVANEKWQEWLASN